MKSIFLIVYHNYNLLTTFLTLNKNKEQHTTFVGDGHSSGTEVPDPLGSGDQYNKKSLFSQQLTHFVSTLTKQA